MVAQPELRLVKKREDEFCPTRVKGNRDLQRQVRQLEGGRLEQFLQNDKDTMDAESESTGWLTPQGNISLAIRRNLGNSSAQDLGLQIMCDVSKQSVLRAECRTGASLLASSRLWFQEWQFEDAQIDLQSKSFVFIQYREDATNHKHKLTAMEVAASWANASSDEELQQFRAKDFTSIRRLADVVPVHCGDGPSTLSLSKKMLETSLFCFVKSFCVSYILQYKITVVHFPCSFASVSMEGLR